MLGGKKVLTDLRELLDMSLEELERREEWRVDAQVGKVWVVV